MPVPTADPVRASIREEAALHRRIDELTLRASHVEPGPEGAIIEPVVVDRLLVAIGDDPHTDLAVALANELAPLFSKHVTLAHVIEAATGAKDEAERVSLARLDVARRQLRDLTEVDVAIAQGPPGPELVRLAVSKDTHLAIVGSPPHSGLERWLLRSAAQRLKDHAPCHVLLAKSAPSPGDILCAVDGSWQSQRAAALAYRMTRAWGSTLRLLHVLRPPASGTELEWATSKRAVLEKLNMPWQEPRGVECRFRIGDPPRIIVDEASRTRPVLLVMGGRGLSGLRSLVSGSVTNHVAHHVDTSMIIVK